MAKCDQNLLLFLTQDFINPKPDTTELITMHTDEFFDLIASRRSIGNLNAPAPTHAQVERAVQLAYTAPDHKCLQPFRFIVLEGEALARLGDALHQATLDIGETDAKALDKARNLPLRAPMVITCLTAYQAHAKVPPYEQLLAAGAAVQNLLLALHAMGFGSVWRTGALTDSTAVKQFFALDDSNHVVGFIYVGTTDVQMPERAPLNLDSLLGYWA